MNRPEDNLNTFLQDLDDDRSFEMERPLIEMDLADVETALIASQTLRGVVADATISEGRILAGRPTWRSRKAALAVAAMVLLSVGALFAVANLGLDSPLPNSRITKSSPGDWSIQDLCDPPSASDLEAGGFSVHWRRAALIVGVTQYRDPAIRGRSTGAMDVERAVEIAVTHFLAPRKNVIHLSEGAATEAAVRSALIYLSQFSAPDDLVLLHVVCNGYSDGESPPLFQFYDSSSAGGISEKEFLQLLGPTKGKVVLVADIRDSGQSLDTWETTGKSWVVAWSGTGENAFEAPLAPEVRFASVWYNALLGEADANGDGLVTIVEAFGWTRKEMIEGRAHGHPVLFRPAEGPSLVLSVHPKFRGALPSWGAPIAAPSPLRLTRASGSDLAVSLDGRALGVMRGAVTVLPVTTGEHEVKVCDASVPSEDADDQRTWSAAFTAAPGRSVDLHISFDEQRRP